MVYWRDVQFRLHCHCHTGVTKWLAIYWKHLLCLRVDRFSILQGDEESSFQPGDVIRSWSIQSNVVKDTTLGSRHECRLVSRLESMDSENDKSTLESSLEPGYECSKLPVRARYHRHWLQVVGEGYSGGITFG